MKKTKTRLIGRRGIEHVVLKLEDVALINRVENVVFAVDKDEKKYIIDKCLSELENDLDQAMFFRANRQFILNINHIRSFKKFETVKLSITLSLPSFSHIIVSQETAPLFKKWMLEEY